MTENKIFTLNITQVPATKEGDDDDYKVSACIHHGGLSLEFERTVSEIRRFFTERRERTETKPRDGKHLQSLPKAGKDK